MLETVVIVVHLLVALGVVGFVVVQQGKGADAGASFGAGASATVFGSQGSATFLSRATAILASIFFITSLGLAFFAKEKSDMMLRAGLPDPEAVQVQQEKPVGDVPALEQKSPEAGSVDVPASPEEK